MGHNLVIRGGTIADGSGAPLFEGDIAVDGDKIVAVGKVSAKGAEEIDAKGLLVTPGFVDIHTHYDGQSLWEDRLIPSSWHGVTTTVFGNCGVGFAPVKSGDRDLLIELMEGIEDIPRNILEEGLDWNWNSFSEFLDALETRRHDIDICAQVPHAALRIFVMGKRAMDLEKATEKDIAEMRRLTTEAIQAGAIGVSTSRLPTHQTRAGDFTPTLGASDDEIVALAMGVADAGRGVLQFTSELAGDVLQPELALVERMQRESGRPLSMTVRQRHNEPESWKTVIAAMEALNAEGYQWRGQVAPRSVGTLYSLLLRRHPFFLHPSYQPIATKPLEEKLAIFRDPTFRAKLLAEQPVHKNQRNIDRVKVFERMFALGNPPDYEPTKERSIASIAKAQGRTPEDIAYDMLLEDEGRALIFAPASNYAGFNLDVCKALIENPHTCLGLSDGGAHVASLSDSNFPTWMLMYWGRDRKRGPKIDLPWLVRWMTGATASTVGLTDRGLIKAGLKADLNVIDHDKLTIGRPYITTDLPCGGERMVQKSYGYVATILSGQVTARGGEQTDALPGRLVRR